MRLDLTFLMAFAFVVQSRDLEAREGGRSAQSPRSDWQVHRKDADVVGQLVRALKAHPRREDLARRLMRGRSPKVVDVLLSRFAQDTVEQSADHGAQLAYAQVLLAAGRWQEAATRFGIASEMVPDDFASRWGKALALEGMGSRRGALAELRAALALAREGDDVIRAGRRLINAASIEGDVDAEVEGRTALLRRLPRPRLVLDLAAAMNRAGRPREAAEVLAMHVERLARSADDRSRWALAEGQYRANGGDLMGAAAALERARRFSVGRGTVLRREIWSSLIDVARRRGTLDALKEDLTTPSDSVEWVARARIADESGDLLGARAAFDEAIRQSPGDVNLRLRRIAVARRVADKRDVARLYVELAAVAARGAHENPTVLVEALEGLWQLGDAEAAGHTIDQILANGPHGTPLLHGMAEGASRWGDEHRAERCWRALLKRVPGDEAAVVALGELQLQRGQRRVATDTWRTLLRGSARTTADAHARVAEILADHDFPDLALAETRAAVALASGVPRYHRLLATILERQGRDVDAEREWEIVIRSASGADRIAERKEARARLLAVWSRGGGGRLVNKLREMEEALERDGRDREMLLFLVEAQIKTKRVDAAIDLLTQRLSADWLDHHLDSDSDADADLILLLVRTLRHAHRLDDAMTWLERLARRFPDRAREAHLQLADIALLAHDDNRAQEFSELAATRDSNDPRVILRAAAVQERLGHFKEAAAMYRPLVGFEHHQDTAAALALASLLSRLGDVEEQRALLREVLCHSTDDEMISTAGARAIVLEEASGTLEVLESLVADTPDLNAASPEASARRRVLAAILWRLVPAVYRRQWRDANALATLRQFARHGTRPLLDLVSTPDADPDVHAIEVLGMLGRTEAVPGLARVLDLDAEEQGANVSVRAGRGLPDELVSVTLIALGRLGGDVARAAVESVEQHVGPASRLALIWALGRVGSRRALEIAKQEIARKSTDAAVIGCLAIGRSGGAEAEPLLSSAAEDPSEPPLVRAAAILGLGLGLGPRDDVVVPALGRYVDTADRTLALAARTALGWLGHRTNDGRRGSGLPAVASVDDEAAAIVGGQVDVAVLVQALETPDVVPPFEPVDEGRIGPVPDVGKDLRE